MRPPPLQVLAERAHRAMVFLYCDVCGTAFTEASAQSARSCRDGHRRTQHGPRRNRVRRCGKHAPRAPQAGVTPTASYIILVLCPQRREQEHRLFSTTKALLVDRGFVGTHVLRLEGWDLQWPMHQHRYKAGFLLDYFLDVFWPYVWARFAADPALEYVLWTEAVQGPARNHHGAGAGLQRPTHVRGPGGGPARKYRCRPDCFGAWDGPLCFRVSTVPPGFLNPLGHASRSDSNVVGLCGLCCRLTHHDRGPLCIWGKSRAPAFPPGMFDLRGAVGGR